MQKNVKRKTKNHRQFFKQWKWILSERFLLLNNSNIKKFHYVKLKMNSSRNWIMKVFFILIIIEQLRALLETIILVKYETGTRYDKGGVETLSFNFHLPFHLVLFYESTLENCAIDFVIYELNYCLHLLTFSTLPQFSHFHSHSFPSSR